MPSAGSARARSRRWLVAALGVMLISPAAVSRAQLPGDPVVRLVVGLSAGPHDTATRWLAEGLKAELGQSVIVENRPGADGSIAARHVATAPPDGRTLLSAFGSQLVVNPQLYPSLGFEPQRDLVPVTLVARTPIVLVVHPSVPSLMLRDFVAYTKANPGTVNYGTTTSMFMLAGELLKQRTGADMQNIPFSGGASVLPAILSGTVHAAVIPGSVAIPSAREGRIRALAVLSPARPPQLPDVPTFAEAGVPDFDVPTWTAVFAPAGTPREVVDRLHAALVRVLGSAPVRERFEANADTIVAGTPDALAETVRRDAAAIKALVARLGLAPR